MKIAVLSDIHGNKHALEAVLNDIKHLGIEKLIFVGDYLGEFSNPNEVLALIKNNNNYEIVSGNKERYFEDDHFSTKDVWVHDHFSGLYWNHEHITSSNHEYMSNMSREKYLTYNNQQILCTHDISDIFKNPSFRKFSSSNYSLLHSKQDMDKKDYLNYVKATLIEDMDFIDELNTIDARIIITGHSHVQWHCFIGDKLLLNPGSIGLPLDHQVGAAYTIINIKDDEVAVEEKRIKYNLDAAINELKKSDLYIKAKFWCDMAISQLQSGKDEISFFFKHVGLIQRNYESKSYWPVDNDIYREACLSWEDSKGNLIP